MENMEEIITEIRKIYLDNEKLKEKLNLKEN